MKRHFAATALLFLALSPVLPAQEKEEASVTVRNIIHEDGSRTETITNLAEKTQEERTYTIDNKVTQRKVSKLDQFGQSIEGVVYNAKGHPVSRFQLVRNSFGHVTEQRDYTVDGQPYQRRIFRLSGDGNVVGIDTYDGKGNLVHTTGSSQRARRQGNR